MSTSADSKVLLEARNKSDEIQRRLKGEKVPTTTDTPMCRYSELAPVVDTDIACPCAVR